MDEGKTVEPAPETRLDSVGQFRVARRATPKPPQAHPSNPTGDPTKDDLYLDQHPERG